MSACIIGNVFWCVWKNRKRGETNVGGKRKKFKDSDEDLFAQFNNQEEGVSFGSRLSTNNINTNCFTRATVHAVEE